jgi:hypothetical protein
VRINIQRFEKMLIRATKIQDGYKKNAEFHADFKSVKKVVKKCTKKVICKNLMEICIYSIFTHVRQTCFAYKFFLRIFKKLFQRI